MIRLLLVLSLTSSTYFLGAQIVNVEDRRGTFTDTIGWFESLELGFNLIQNNDRIVNIKGSFYLEVLQKKRVFLSITKFEFIRAGDQNFVDQGFQHLRFTRIISNRLRFETFGQIQYNEQILVRLRALAGAGPRLRIHKDKKSKAYYGIAYMYEYEEKSESTGGLGMHRISTYLSAAYKISKSTFINSTTYYQPSIMKISDFRFLNETTINFKIIKNLYFRNSFSLIYDSQVFDSAPELTYELSNSIRYNF